MTDQRLPVLLYDGECGLCNWVVRFLLRRDRGARIHFAPLQSAPAQDYLKSKGLPASDFGSLVFVPDWKNPGRDAPMLRTTGALAALAELGGAWRVVSWLRVLPAFLRDPFYIIVSRTRYAIFGKYKPAPLPDPEWEKRFLSR